MSIEERKTMIRRLVEEAFSKGNLAIVDETLSLNYVLHTADGNQLTGPEAWKQFILGRRNGFPDIRCAVEDIACDGDILALRTTLTGTNTGSFMGMPPTGKKASIQMGDFFRFEDDKPVEQWQFVNQLALLQQLGVAPPAMRPSN